MDIKPHRIAAGARCQLLVGSFRGATRNCSCYRPDECLLTEEERNQLRGHPFVVKCQQRNLDEFNSILNDNAVQ